MSSDGMNIAESRYTRVMGIDPGSRHTGYGLVDIVKRQVRYVASGVIDVSNDGTVTKLGTIYERIFEQATLHKPHLCAVEEVFLHRNPSSALKLGQARGAAIAAAAMADIKLMEYSANQVKKAVVGKGHANKLQVQHMVRVLTGLNKKFRSDESDALAIALCAAFHYMSKTSVSTVLYGTI